MTKDMARSSQSSVTMGLPSRTTTVTLRTARVFAISSPTPEEPDYHMSRLSKTWNRWNIPPVTTTSWSLQSSRGGPKSRLPWFLYKREYHLKNPEDANRLVVAVTQCARVLTECRDCHVIERIENKDRLGPASAAEVVEKWDEEGKEWALKSSLQ